MPPASFEKQSVDDEGNEKEGEPSADAEEHELEKYSRSSDSKGPNELQVSSR
jgi:hypothetical protein